MNLPNSHVMQPGVPSGQFATRLTIVMTLWSYQRWLHDIAVIQPQPFINFALAWKGHDAQCDEQWSNDNFRGYFAVACCNLDLAIIDLDCR